MTRAKQKPFTIPKPDEKVPLTNSFAKNITTEPGQSTFKQALQKILAQPKGKTPRPKITKKAP